MHYNCQQQCTRRVITFLLFLKSNVALLRTPVHTKKIVISKSLWSATSIKIQRAANAACPDKSFLLTCEYISNTNIT